MRKQKAQSGSRTRLSRDTRSPSDIRALLGLTLAAIVGGKITRDVRAALELLAEMG